MTRRTKVGVVTVTYNSEPVIDEFMVCMMSQTHQDFALFIVDNASKDRTLMKIAQWRDPRIKVVANSANCGVAKGNNQGIQAALDADCEVALLLNNDTAFDAGFLEKLNAALDETGGDMIAPKIMFSDNPQVIWWAGGKFDRLRAYYVMHDGYGEIDRGQFNQTRQVEYAPTCCLLIKREVFAKIGFMDERYFVYSDDADFCFRANQAGLKLYYSPTCTLLHKVSSLTGGAQSEFTVRYSNRNRVFFILKNLNILQGLVYLVEMQVYFLFRLLSRADSLLAFRWRQRAFLEGLRVGKAQPGQWLNGRESPLWMGDQGRRND